jgi:hypothetical protein
MCKEEIMLYHNMIATFLYRIRGDSVLHHGKYVGPCPIYEEGLDRALLEIFAPFFQEFYGVETSEVQLGVLSVDREAKDYYSEEEKYVFDLFYGKWPAMEEEVFFCGEAKRMPCKGKDRI